MIRDFSLDAQTTTPPVFKLESMAQADLISLRGQIDNVLKLELKHLNLTEELSLQFKQAKSLLDEILQDEDIPANQKSQVMNSTTAIIANIAKAQADLYSAERLKAIEAATVKALKTLPKEAQEAFFSIYERYLQDTP